MNSTRATNRTAGTNLMDQSRANPAAFDMAAFSRGGTTTAGAPAGQGTTNSNYLRECQEQNPEPGADQGTTPQVSLAKCQFVTPRDELRLNEEFEFSVEVTKTGTPTKRRAFFDLFCTRTRDGKEERTRIWAGKEGFPVDDKAEPMVVKAKGVLATQADYVLGEPVKFELEARHDEADGRCKSEPLDFSLVTQATWAGGDDLFFRTDGEFPLLGADASLVQVLAEALKRVEKPPQKDAETTICFGFASSAGDASLNRKLSLRRAKAVRAILERDTAAWSDLAKANFETRDAQQFLSDLHAACGWECDPGEVDGQAGPQTKAAIEAFQREANTRYKLGLREDGDCGPKTWSAVLRALHGQIQSALGQDPQKEPTWKKPKWGHGGKGVYANGEDFATGGDQPEERSVQITFFSPGSEPVLIDAPDAETTTVTHNPVQNPQLTKKQKIGTARGAGTSTSPPNADGIVVFYTNSPSTLAQALKVQMGLNPKPQKGTSSGKFVDATEAESLDALDPTKHATGDGMYQFLDLSSSNGISEADMAAYLADKGVLAGHAKDFLEAAAEAGISEAYAAVHACLETGNGTSKLATGMVVNNVTVHNMFGIGALDGKAEATGSKKAAEQGWTTPELAIRGGIKWIAHDYILNAKTKQNTLYKMRWNPDKPGTHQYATAHNWATAQVAKIKKIAAAFPKAKKVFEVTRYQDQTNWIIPGYPDSGKPTPSAPAAPTPALDDQFKDLRALVTAAEKDGYNKADTISALRKIWYPGKTWDKIIPGAAAVKPPPSWSTTPLQLCFNRVKQNQVMALIGGDVDLGHLFTGADAKNHPTKLNIAVIKLRSNQEQATFVGDLGSVVAEYIHNFPGSFYDLGRKLNKSLLAKKFDEFCPESDMSGNIDSYLIDFNSGSIMSALDTYYALGLGMPLQRRQRFVPTVKGTTRNAWQEELFNSALGYAGGEVLKKTHPDWVIDVASVVLDPGPGLLTDLPFFGDIGTPTWWEVYFNVSQWTADLFLERYGKTATPAPAPVAPVAPPADDDENGTGTRVAAPWMDTALDEAARWKGADESVITKTINYHKEIGVGLPDLNGTDHAWCASFVNYCLDQAGFEMSAEKARARSFKTDKNFTKLDKPQYGAIACIADHHVCFVVADDEKSDYMVTLGGNTSNTIKYNVFKESTTYYLPKTYNKDTPSTLPTSTAAKLNATIGIGAASGGATTR